ncbi:MAG: GMC family oxidoreductase [Helicobacteraceae bacterium]|jgi:choline dehydrogenase-like flavoprotein|nr:GMC family oxidoreductase [Helicobacteraceae bacterium]
MIKTADICIIGSGAGGAPVAYTLALAGFKVIVLEKGPLYNENDFKKDEIAVSRRSLYTPKLKDEQHVIETFNDNGEIIRETGEESGWNFWNGSMVGGSSNLMSGYFHRMKPNDFKLKTVFGEVEGANVVDWPIDYETMEPYYTKVEELVGVSGKMVEHPFREPRSTADYPYPQTWEHPIADWIDASCSNLGYNAMPTPRAILPYDAMGRRGCSYSNLCGSYGCATGAKSHAKSALLDKAVSSGNCEILPDAFVYKIESIGDSVNAVHYYDKSGDAHTVEAKIYVLAAQATESSRLLLNSKSVDYPNGLANNGGLVGKNLIFSAGGTGSGRLNFENLPKERQESLLLRGAFVNRSIQDWYEYDENEQHLKGGTIDFLFEHANAIPRALDQVYDNNGDLLWGKALSKSLHHTFERSRVMTFEVFNDWLPTDNCFVSVDEEVKDKWGMPVGKLRLYGHPHDLKVGQHLADKAVKVLKDLGCEDVTSSISDSPPPNLVAGGCRFGTDPATSVLDVNCKAHEVANLYVTDASFMPTGGSVPYTWTIYANAFRVADKIIERLKNNV